MEGGGKAGMDAGSKFGEEGEAGGKGGYEEGSKGGAGMREQGEAGGRGGYEESSKGGAEMRGKGESGMSGGGQGSGMGGGHGGGHGSGKGGESGSMEYEHGKTTQERGKTEYQQGSKSGANGGGEEQGEAHEHGGGSGSEEAGGSGSEEAGGSGSEDAGGSGGLVGNGDVDVKATVDVKVDAKATLGANLKIGKNAAARAWAVHKDYLEISGCAAVDAVLKVNVQVNLKLWFDANAHVLVLRVSVGSSIHTDIKVAIHVHNTLCHGVDAHVAAPLQICVRATNVKVEGHATVTGVIQAEVRLVVDTKVHVKTGVVLNADVKGVLVLQVKPFHFKLTANAHAHVD